MRWLTRTALAAALGAAGAAAAAADVEPAGGRCPPVVLAPPCPPSWLPIPLPPMAPPGQPTPAPGTPPAPGQPPLTPPPADAGADRPGVPSASSLLAEAPARGTSSGGSLLPNVNGDLLGGGGIAGPLPVVSRGGLGGVPTNGGSGGIPPSPAGAITPDEYLRSLQPPAAAPNGPAPAGGTVIGVFPPAGQTFDRRFAGLVSRIPQVVRGAFKITENESPRPTTRLYTSYYYYDQVFRHFGGPGTPRLALHQEVIGGEYAFLGDRASVGARLPYNQLVGGSFYNNTALGDLTLIGKAVLAGDPAAGSLLSGGMAVTVPTGRRPFASTITGDRIYGTLLQPYLGFIRAGDRGYVQGFSSVVVPTDSRDVTFLANDVQLGYFLLRNGTGLVSAVVPTVEGHLNTPLNRRGSKRDPVGFVDQFTVLGGAQFLFRDRAGLGVSTGAPLTGPRPFSLQVSVQFNVWF